MAIDVLRPTEITASLRADWRALQAADADVAGPFFAPEWAGAVERARGGVRIAVQYDAQGLAAVLPIGRGRFTAGAPGGPLADYDGLIARRGAEVDMPGLLMAMGVARYDFAHAPASQPMLAAGMRGRGVSWRVDAGRGWAAYQATLKSRKSDLVRDVGKRLRRIEREVGPVEFRFADADANAFAAMLRWKREQYAATRQTDVLARPWTQRLLGELSETRGDVFGGLFSTLRAGDQLLAGHFGLYANGVLHAWFIAHDTAFARFSPGMVLMGELTRALCEGAGWREFDLGSGDYAFKARLCDAGRDVGYGFVGRPSPAAAFRGGAYAVRGWAERAPLGRLSALPGKAMRRWDIIRALG